MGGGSTFFYSFFIIGLCIVIFINCWILDRGGSTDILTLQKILKKIVVIGEVLSQE